MLVVGNVVGETGLAAISNASMISFIINSICIGVTMGGTVLIAQYKGADDKQIIVSAREAISGSCVIIIQVFSAKIVCIDCFTKLLVSISELMTNRHKSKLQRHYV